MQNKLLLLSLLTVIVSLFCGQRIAIFGKQRNSRYLSGRRGNNSKNVFSATPSLAANKGKSAVTVFVVVADAVLMISSAR